MKKWSLTQIIKSEKIELNSLSSTLTVVVTDDGQISTLPQMLDLKWLLPEMAVVYLVL
jgi:hypothetical protein